MSARHPNPRLAKLARSYTVPQVARLFGKHPGTVLQWIKDGLRPLDSRKPRMISGAELRRFLEMRRARSKRPCPPGTIYCLRCRGPRRPLPTTVVFREPDAGPGNLLALCEGCQGRMNRRANAAMLALILPDVVIRKVRA